MQPAGARRVAVALARHKPGVAAVVRRLGLVPRPAVIAEHPTEHPTERVAVHVHVHM